MNCYHCAEPLPAGAETGTGSDATFRADLAGETRAFCCAGCLAVAQTIYASGLGNYYQFRQAPAKRQSAELPRELLAALEQSARATACLQESADESRVALFVEGLNCPACSWLLERHLRQQAGVHDVQIQLTARRLLLRWDHRQSSLQQMLAELQHIGYQATPFSPDQVEQQLEQESRDLLKRLAVAGFGMMQAMMYAVGLYLGVIGDLERSHELWLRWSSLLVALPVLLYSCQPFFRNAWSALKLRSLNMNVPVAAAMLLAFVASSWNTVMQSGAVYFESVSMFAFLLLLGRFLELKVRQRATRAAGLQQRLLPRTARRWHDNEWHTVALAEVKTGERLLVQSGETVPVDAAVVSGSAGADESLLNGEPALVAKRVGDAVLAGSVISGGALEITVTNSGSDTYVAKLTRLQDEALAQRPPLQLQADRLARWFVAGVLLLAVLVFAGWYPVDATRAFDVTLAVLVVTCPCALSLALPTAWAAATHQLLQDGVLLRRAAVLEKLANLTDVVFDKTGTLTTGQLQITGVRTRSVHFSDQALAIAAALEQHSSHPIAKAFHAYCEPHRTDQHGTAKQSVAQQQSAARLHASEVNETAGLGVVGLVDGTRYWLGQANWLPANARSAVQEGEIALADDSGWLASFCLQDELRPDAALLCRRLQARGLQLHLASGDHAEAVRACAQALGIADAHARQSPADKRDRVQALQQQGRRVLMLGDGINDGPVLAAADVSIAIGSGADFARRAADAVLLHSQLASIDDALALARQTRRIVRENLMWALVYNAVALPAAISGVLTPWQAAVGMSLSSLLVTVNSLRLLRGKTVAATLPPSASLIEQPA
ncbi:heavy metal translocating P-type ATPase [Permianibacter sp. IMCC34836]|uniref:heavy metal translocating P-type ATPase n=1 Tax=Permianibacter fluminis TaxID=2738515 RepID=UPI001552EEA4|nr:heavy metal translocating P-type ATPase [Permianibacter fluminis]NQD37908.1 heavy metal translocating P-type ATPase [Permianibacter fluminis]